MLICHCRAVNDRQIRDAVIAGATAPEDLAAVCGAGGRCGGCLPALRTLIDELDVSRSRRQTTAA